MLLNVGCGPDYKDGWCNVDVDWTEDRKPDLIADVRDLPLPDGVAEQSFAGHVLEHLDWDYVVPALVELRRVTKPGAPLCVVGPDVLRLPLPWHGDEADRTLWGTRHHAHDYHVWPCSERVVIGLMQVAGFEDVQPIDLPKRRDIVRQFQITGPEITAQCCVIGRAPENGG